MILIRYTLINLAINGCRLSQFDVHDFLGNGWLPGLTYSKYCAGALIFRSVCMRVEVWWFPGRNKQSLKAGSIHYSLSI